MYKISELHVENIKNIKVIDITPDNDAIVLTGKNRAGKTATLESIEMALTGDKIECPIRNGEKKGVINITLFNSQTNEPEFYIKKIFTSSGARLEITSPGIDGKMKSPQTVLDELKGKLCFDPIEFISIKENKQRDQLINFIDFDFEAYKKNRQEAYDSRKNANANIDKFKKQLLSYADVDSDTPLRVVNVDSKMKQLDNIKEIRKFKEDGNEAIRYMRDEISDNYNKIEELKNRINVLNDDILQKESELNDIQDFTDEEIAKVSKEISDASSINEKVVRANEKHTLVNNLDEASKIAKKHDDTIKKLDNDKSFAIKNGNYPIEGLSVDDKCVLYNEVPLSQISSAEQVKVSMSIAISLNPKIKVILIREGSLLDNDMYNAIKTLAIENGFQIWIEKVYVGDKSGLYIEAGEISDFPVDDNINCDQDEVDLIKGLI